ncbi:Uncharacterised protein [Starkeya nomas]|uniref:Tape measure protein N-terminal domain-containing protein n=1 Tax=Starkeya nomas TaxID=2666134 RepID=A0A5S9N9X1_9HYPH|nr:tape measure protein [Starkeya nomas]CAA0086885.1 Uncharacterised protein [Starkeya nomas]
MRVSLLLEAQDKASRAIRAAQKSVAGFNQAAVAGAEKAAKATAKAAAAQEKVERAARAAGKAAAAGASAGLAAQSRQERILARVGRAQELMARGARRAGEMSRSAAALAERGWQRALTAITNYARRQGELIVKGGGMMGAGAAKAWEGAKGAGRVAAGVATGAGVLGVAGGLLMNQLVTPAAEFERYSAVLETIEGSAAGASKSMDWISAFATKTPYDLSGVTEAFVKMRAYGLQPMNGSLRTLGDTAAAMDKPLIQAVEAIADAVTGENERLKEFGVKASAKGKYFEYAFTDKNRQQRVVKALASDRAAIEKALLWIFDNKYAGAMDRLSQTWGGMTSNLGDVWQRVSLMIMDAGLFDWMKGRLGDVLGAVDRMAADGSLQAWAKDISTTLIATLSKGWEVAKGLAAAVGTVAQGAERVASAIGGWENFSYLLIAAAFAQPIYYLASGLFLMARGAWVASFALLRVLAILSVSTTMWAFSAATRAAAGAVMLLGRSLIFLGVGSIRGAILGIALLARGLVGLPGLLIRAALATKALALASLRLPSLLLGAARGIAAMAMAGLRSLPALLAGMARGVLVLAGAGLRALPGLLLAAARGMAVFGASMMATPVGWIVAGVAAIAAAAYLIYQNWDSIGPWLAEKWAQVKQVFADAWNALAGFDWSSLLPDWSSWLPDWSWSSIIPAITLPSFDWSSLLPDWNWSSIIPSLPDFSSWFGGGASAPVAAGAVGGAQDMQQLAAQAEAAQRLIAGIAPAAQAAVQAASSVLSGASFHSHGVALMATLAAGIRAGAGAAVSAVQGVTQQMRDYLPHSPAKVGPLSDLDRVRFSETLASAIRPGPAVTAARSVAAGMRGALSDMAPRSAGLPIGMAGAGAGGSGGAATVQVSYAPSIAIPAGTPAQQSQSFAQQLRDHADELARLVDEALRRRQRKEY